MTARTLFVISLSLAVSLPAYGEIYRHTDKNGNVVFTDQPPEHAEPVELRPLNTVPGGSNRRVRNEESDESAPAAAAIAAAYTSLQLSGVADGDMLQNPDGGISISASADIPLQPDHRMYFIENGKEVTAGDTEVYVIESLTRGEHSFVAQIRDADGRVLISSKPVTIQVHRTMVPPARVRPR